MLTQHQQPLELLFGAPGSQQGTQAGRKASWKGRGGPEQCPCPACALSRVVLRAVQDQKPETDSQRDVLEPISGW